MLSAIAAVPEPLMQVCDTHAVAGSHVDPCSGPWRLGGGEQQEALHVSHRTARACRQATRKKKRKNLLMGMRKKHGLQASLPPCNNVRRQVIITRHAGRVAAAYNDQWQKGVKL